jgi:hypothetical protein
MSKQDLTTPQKVAVFSNRNIFWKELGRLQKGINILSAEKANEWVSNGYARIVTPEEVAKEYGI